MNTTDFSILRQNTRSDTFETLQLISSKAEQLDYQQRVPIVDVAVELFCSWESCFQDLQNYDWYIETFSEAELKALKKFNTVLESVCSEMPDQLPHITDFIKTKLWNALSKAASLALEELEANAT